MCLQHHSKVMTNQEFSHLLTRQSSLNNQSYIQNDGIDALVYADTFISTGRYCVLD